MELISARYAINTSKNCPYYWDKLAQKLLEKEVLQGDELRDIIDEEEAND
jgi:hypothetical protein